MTQTSKLNNVLIISRQPPYSSLSANEALDAALASAAFGVEVGLLLLDDALFQLTANHQPQTGLKPVSGLIKSLSLYDIDKVFVCPTQLSARGLTTTDLLIPVELVPDDNCQPLFSRYRHLLTF